MRRAKITALMAVLTILFSACNLPVAPSGTPTGGAAVLSQVAVTVDALLTEQAAQTQQAAQSTPEPAATTPAVAETPASPTPTSAPPTATLQPCDLALFVQDVTVPDGSRFGPGQGFTKTWRLKNIGTCTWTRSYSMAFLQGDALGAPAVVSLPGEVAPNQTVDVSVEMKAPAALGKYTSWWQLRNASGVLFEMPFYAMIEVVANTLTPTITLTPGPSATISPSGVVYDFTASACLAEWVSAAGALPCPGQSEDARGFVIPLSNPLLESGVTETNPTLLTYPEAKENGIIAGAYPAITVQPGYRFRATLGCLNNNPDCKVKFQLNYREGSGTPANLGQWDQVYDNSVQGVDVDLSSLAGRSVQLILVVLADGPATEDQAVWVFPRVVK